MAVVYRHASIEAAQIAGESPVMDQVAQRVAQVARGLAASHNVTGEYLSGIGTERVRGKRGVTDRIAFVDATAAAAREFGHVQGYRKGFTGPAEYVDGLHIFARAAAQA